MQESTPPQKPPEKETHPQEKYSWEENEKRVQGMTDKEREKIYNENTPKLDE